MSVLSSKALQEQLSVILGALTKAALVEICELVEEGYSVLQLEISRSHQENQDLRKKLHLIESIVVRGGGGGGDCGQSRAAAPEGGTGATGAAARPETPRDRERGEAAAGDGGAAEVEVEEVPDVVLIKDEDSDGFDIIEDGERKQHDGGAAAVGEGVPSTPVIRRRRRRSRVYEDAETASSEHLALKAAKPGAGSQQSGSVYGLDDPSCSAQLLEDVQMKAADSVCSYPGQMDPDVHLVQECSLVPPGPGRQVFFSSSALMEPPSTRADLDLNLDPPWTKQPKASISFAQFCENENMDGDAFGLKMVGVSGSADSRGSAFEYESGGGGGGALGFGLYGEPPGQSQLSAGDSDDDPQRKRFVCSICNKTYATAQNLEVHTRIHTGERPFACDQCGKKFTQSAHLRSHLNVHTGERPYSCSLCSRSFIVKYSLKLHMKKCHPNN